MPPQTPYTADLGDRQPLAAIRETTDRIRSLTSAWTTPHFERSYAPGKWSARLILTHLAQAEVALGTRARMALTVPNYASQSFDQDQWIAKESHLSGPDAVEAFLALARMNFVLFNALPPADCQATLTHPEYGTITVDWIIHTIAGHQRHHLVHLEAIAKS
jgi:DinB family protein